MVAETYDFWLFDLDGTLVDVEHEYAREVLEAVGDRLGCNCEFTDRDVTVLWYGLNGSREAHLAEKGIGVEEFWETFHEVEDPIARAESTYLHDDADVVTEIDAPVGVVTHCQRYLTEPVLEHLDIGDWFDTVVCCDDDLGWKPDPDPVYRAMRDLGVADGKRVATDGGRTMRGVLAGDGPTDIGAAWNAGLDGIHVERHGPDLRGQCVLGDYRVASFDQLPGF